MRSLPNDRAPESLGSVFASDFPRMGTVTDLWLLSGMTVPMRGQSLGHCCSLSIEVYGA
jgi:hypothetical protein